MVDDEPHIAVTLSEILERRGYLTVWFTQPVAALALMEAYKPDLLLTDFTMPILDGLALACRVKVMYPDCPVLMVSAIGNDPQITHRISQYKSRIWGIISECLYPTFHVNPAFGLSTIGKNELHES